MQKCHNNYVLKSLIFSIDEKYMCSQHKIFHVICPNATKPKDAWWNNHDLSLAQTLQVIHLRLTCDWMFELLGIDCNKSFNMLNTCDPLISQQILTRSSKRFSLSFLKCHKLSNDSSYNMIQPLILVGIPSNSS